MSKTLSAEAEHKPYFTTKRMALIGVMTAVTCILGPFSIPLPFSPVPISFTNLAIYLAAYVLGMKACTISYLIYMLLGMVGVPVFPDLRQESVSWQDRPAAISSDLS